MSVAEWLETGSPDRWSPATASRAPRTSVPPSPHAPRAHGRDDPPGRSRPSDVEAPIVTKRDAGLSGSTVRTIYTVLRSARDSATRDGLIRSNPAAAVRRPGVERKDALHLTVVQEHLGHSSYAITADIYSHVGPAQQREAADRLDQALRW